MKVAGDEMKKTTTKKKKMRMMMLMMMMLLLFCCCCCGFVVPGVTVNVIGFVVKKRHSVDGRKEGDKNAPLQFFLKYIVFLGTLSYNAAMENMQPSVECLLKILNPSIMLGKLANF